MRCLHQTVAKRRCQRSARTGKYCTQHTQLELNPQATRIQATWRARKARRIVTAVFRPLPRDLQRRVLFYLSEPLLLELHHYRPLRRVIRGYVFRMCLYIDAAAGHDETVVFAYILHVLHLVQKYSIILIKLHRHMRVLHLT